VRSLTGVVHLSEVTQVSGKGKSSLNLDFQFEADREGRASGFF